MPTIADVARECGVSPSTVSYVLNNGPRSVREETRRRVLATVERLSYDPSAIARGLRRKRMDAFGVVFPHEHPSLVTNPYFAAILDGILAVATFRRQNATLFTGHIWSDESHSLPVYCDGRCDGLLLIAPRLGSDIVRALRRKSVPFVVISGEPVPEEISLIDIDNVAAARELVEHLIARGHRRIALLRGSENTGSAVLRRQGYLEALAAHGIPREERLDIPGLYSEDSGAERTHALMTGPRAHRPTAIFCASDDVALGALRALSELGLNVPDDVSVVGFDDIPAAAAAHPPLTTVHQPIRQLGERAAELLLDSIEAGDTTPHREHLPTRLVLRETVGPPSRSLSARHKG